MIGGAAGEDEPETQLSTRTAAPPPSPALPIAPPSSPLQDTGTGTGLGRRLLGSIRASLALPPPPPPADAPKVGLGLLLPLGPDHPLPHPQTPSPSASEDPLEEAAAAAPRRRAYDAELRSPLDRYRIADAAATSAPTNAMFRQWASKAAPHLLQHLRPAAETDGDHEPPAGDESRHTHVASPSEDDEDDSIATDASEEEDDDPLELEDAAQRPRPRAADADPLSPVNRYRPIDPAARRAPAGNTMFWQWASKSAPHLLRHFRPDAAAAGDDDQEEKVLLQWLQSTDAAAMDYQEVVQRGAIHPRGESETTCGIAVAEDQEKVGSAENVDVLEGQELVEQDVIDRKGEGTDGTAAEGQDKAVEQCDTYGLGTSENGDAKNDRGLVEQCVIDKEGAAMDDNVVKDHEVVGPTEGTDSTHSVVNDISAKDQEKKVEQHAIYDSETFEDDDAVEDQVVVEQGVVYRKGLTIDNIDSAEGHKVVEQSITEGMPASTDIAVEDQKKVVEQCAFHEPRETKDDYTVKDDSVEDHKVVEQRIIEGMPASTDDIAVEDQKKVVEQCAVHRPRATKDEYTVKEKEKVVEQGVIGRQGATDIDVAVKDQDKLMKQHIIDNQGTVPMADIAVKDHDKAAAQYASDAIITHRDDDPAEEHNRVQNQGVSEENGRTKDDIAVEENNYVKEQIIVDNSGTFSDATALEDQKNEAELCKGNKQIAGKDMYAVHMKGSMLEQRAGGNQGATKSDFTVEKHKDVVERVCHEWGAPDDDLAMDTAASQSIREISSSQVVSATANGVKKEKVNLPIRYPQRPRKLNCPFYMSNGSCSYGFSCQFHHPQIKAKSDGSWCPSEQGNHGVVKILELNRIGLPIREGARNCAYYMRNGACRYGKQCHFNHPEHVIDAQFYAPTGWEDNALQLEKSSDHTALDDTSHVKKSSDDAPFENTSYSKKSSDHATLDDTSYLKKSSDHATLDDTSSSSEVLPPSILRMLLPPQKVLPSTEGQLMQVKKYSDWSSTTDDSGACFSADSSDGRLCKQEHLDSSAGNFRKQEHVDYPERPGRPECPFYMRFGDCKFASACKYHHSKDIYSNRDQPEAPSLGGDQTEYPERPGEPECPFYMKNWSCKFGAQCRFNHPKNSNPTVQIPTNAKKSVEANEHHQSTSEDHMPQQQQYPERPGQPDCRYYLQFGECKFLSACIFHHPRDGLPVGWNPSGPAHSDQIEPETDGMPECPFYMRTGKCKFVSACEFRHPKDICSTTEEAFGQRTDLEYDNCKRPENVVQKQEQTMYPERPGEPRCFDYIRHGSCKRQMNCKYHHPAHWLSRKQNAERLHVPLNSSTSTA